MDFALIMLLALGVTGLIWSLDRVWLAPGRRKNVERLRKDGAAPGALEAAAREPLIVEYARAFFPVILIVFLLRSFLVEPFRIPSGSMMPNLLAGDFILVNKFTYGLRIPVANKKIVDINRPQRGDVMVFRFPGDPSVNYIKRVVGLPGDHIVYDDRKLLINDQPMAQTGQESYIYNEHGGRAINAQRLTENLSGVEHYILLTDGGGQGRMEFTVPDGHYFVMGDNRDRSNDSRYWGTVPEESIVGKAFLIWFSWDLGSAGGVVWGRIGTSIH